MDKQPGRRIPRSQLGEIRRNVIGALARGVHPEDAADAFGVGRSTVYKWLSDYQADGLDALLAFRKAPGAAPVTIQPGRIAAGSQGPVVNSWVRASSWSMPHLAAVDRYEWTTAKSASPSRVRQQPPEVRICTLTGRTSRPA